VRRRRATGWIAGTLIVVFSAGGVASAAEPMGGQPLNVFSGVTTDSAGPGGLQARFDGQTAGQFVNPASNATPAGFHIAMPIPGPTTLYGPTDPAQLSSSVFNEQPPGGQPVVSGSGAPGAPLVLTDTYTAGTSPALTIDERLEYVNGNPWFSASYTVSNPSGPVTFRPTLAAHLFIAGGNPGYGVFVPGPPRLVSGINDVVGDGGAFQDQGSTPFLNYQEDQASNIWGALTTGFNNSVNPVLVDPGIGIQWPDTTLGLGAAPVTFQAAVIVGGFNGMTLSPTAANQAPSTQATVTATVENHGKPAAGVPVRYAINGVNSLSGTVTSDASGLARISWTSTQLGMDTVSAYPDSNGNGVRDAGEILRNADITWRFPRPVFGKTANLSRVTGTIIVNTPGPGGPVTVPGSVQVPINSIIDTSKGAVHLITARNITGGTQAGNFHGGKFKLRQKKTKARKGHKGRHHQTADLILLGKSVSCPANGTKANAARRRHRGRVWGNARGSFRTVGQNSAATVKGTKWLVQDSCSGTLTRVVRGTVIVQDFVHHKTVIVKKGHKYLARFR
jgi:hypothetical protein